MKYFAPVTTVIHDGIHTVVTAFDENAFVTTPLPVPTRVEIEVEQTGHAMLYRYQDDGTFCGDTWHETLADAMHQADYEYGIPAEAWQRVS
jgi:hypothetical protein